MVISSSDQGWQSPTSTRRPAATHLPPRGGGPGSARAPPPWGHSRHICSRNTPSRPAGSSQPGATTAAQASKTSVSVTNSSHATRPGLAPPNWSKSATTLSNPCSEMFSISALASPRIRGINALCTNAGRGGQLPRRLDCMSARRPESGPVSLTGALRTRRFRASVLTHKFGGSLANFRLRPLGGGRARLPAVLIVREHVGGHRHPIGEVVHGADLSDVPRLLQRQARVEQRLQIAARHLARAQGQLFGVGADRVATRVQTGPPPVVGDALAEHGVVEL